jgi:hypothetical protein
VEILHRAVLVALVVLVFNPLLLAPRSITPEVVVVLVELLAQVAVLVVTEAGELAQRITTPQGKQLLELQIPAAVVVVELLPTCQRQAQVDLALSLFVMQTPILLLHQPQVRQR